jgi:L-ascorbate metabolism protein UlaG (beta-lactamase superfamily)
MDPKRLPVGNIVLLTHGHFDHGVLMSRFFYENWKCQFVGPRKLIAWMTKKYKKIIPADALIPLNHGESIKLGKIKITAIPAHHPTNRLGKTILSLYARTSAPGNPVNGYYFEGYYQSGDTVYTQEITKALKGMDIHTACLPIGGKYKIANPQDALKIAEEIKAKRLVPMHWQPLVEQVPFRYAPSHLVKLAKSTGSKVEVCPLAIGEVLNDMEVVSNR